MIGLALLLVMAPAWAWDAPERPPAPPVSASDAPASAELYAGDRLPGWLVAGSCTAAVDFGALPLWRWQDYQALEQSYVPQLHQAAQLEIHRLELHQAADRRQIAELEARVTTLEVPPPWWQRPDAYRWQGRAEATTAILIAALALHLATRD